LGAECEATKGEVMGMTHRAEQTRKRYIALLIARACVLLVMIGLAIFIVASKVGGVWVPIVFGVLFTALVVLNILSSVNSYKWAKDAEATPLPSAAGAVSARRKLIAYCATLAIVGVVLGVFAWQIPPIGGLAYALTGLLVTASITIFFVGNARIERRFTPPPSD
jgi:hypothetical protein